jgi:hypothetical protein
MTFGLAKCVLRTIFEKREKDAENYITSIGFLQQIILGYLDEGWVLQCDGMRREGSGG